MNYGSSNSVNDEDEQYIYHENKLSSLNPKAPTLPAFAVVVFLVALSFVAVSFSGFSLPAVEQFIKARGSSDKSVEKLDSMYAPLYFQDIDSSNLVYRFMEKFGLDGTDGETIEMDPSVLSTEKGWAYVTVYPHSNCEGAEYSVGGIMTGTCLPIYSESTTDDANNAKSVMYGCEGGSIIQHRYSDIACTDMAQAKNITTDQCKTLYSQSWGEIDVKMKLYGDIQCTSSNELPLYGTYDLYRVFTDKDASDASDANTALFEANPVDVCIPVEWLGKTHSLVFGLTDDDAPYAAYYDLKSDCSGIPITAELETVNTIMDTNDAYPINSEISFRWEKFWADYPPTPSPSAMPVLVALQFTMSPYPSIAPTVEGESFAPSPAPSPEPPTEVPPSFEPTIQGKPSFKPTDSMKSMHPSVPPVPA